MSGRGSTPRSAPWNTAVPRAGVIAACVALASAAASGPVAAQEAQGQPGGTVPEYELGERKEASANLTVGAVGIDGFGAGFVGTFGWSLAGRAGIEVGAGVGGMQERGGGAVGGFFGHVDLLFPITFNVCASVPRVCPALDFELTLIPGVGYAYLAGDHAGNLILGLAVSSLRKTQTYDVGVRATLLSYIDIVGTAVERNTDRLLGLLQLQLGFVIRWGVAGP
jgi:hypothetical protein